MVDAEDGTFGKDRLQGVIQVLGGGQVVPEGLFDDEAGVVRAARAPEGLDHRAEQARRNGQIVRRPRGTPQGLAQPVEGDRILVITVDVAQPLHQRGECRLIDAPAVLLEAVAGALPQLFDRPARLRDPDDRRFEGAASDHVLQGRENLFICQVPGGAEEHQGIGRHDLTRGPSRRRLSRLDRRSHELISFLMIIRPLGAPHGRRTRSAWPRAPDPQMLLRLAT
jgi:hypothetical protein